MFDMKTLERAVEAAWERQDQEDSRDNKAFKKWVVGSLIFYLGIEILTHLEQSSNFLSSMDSTSGNTAIMCRGLLTGQPSVAGTKTRSSNQRTLALLSLQLSFSLRLSMWLQLHPHSNEQGRGARFLKWKRFVIT